MNGPFRIASEALAPSSTDFRVEIVSTAEALSALEPDWQQLWAACGALIFQSFGWIESWWLNVADRETRQLMIATAWDGPMLVGILPLAIHRHRGLRLLEWAARDHADYCDMLVHPAASPGVAGAMWNAVNRRRGFDLILLNRLLPDARAHALLTSGERPVLMPNHRSEMSLRVVGPHADGEAWFNAQNKKSRQNYRRGVAYLSEGAELRFRLLPPDAEIEPVLTRLSALKRAWLEKMGLEAPLFDQDAPLLGALVDTLRKAGQLRIFVLERDGETIAISINFVDGKTMMAFVTTYDPAVEKGSPGMVLMVDYIRWAFDNGLDLVDFLCGAEDFKSRFASETVTLTSMAGAASLFGKAALTTDRLVRFVRTCRAGLAERHAGARAA
ncbi:MAG: GNAT family N-acetyltransferase [Beijerinckiaceae bacterium]|nr:GNAT family N-acetyltransferase [Beijerinckiaceae bacterium]